MKLISKISVLVLISAIMSCSTGSKDVIPAQENWTQNMRDMATDINLLIPYVYNSTAFEDPKNRDLIASRLRRLSKDIHTIPKKEGIEKMGKDPLIIHSIKNLKEDLVAAEESFTAKQFSYSRSMVKTSLNHCYRCHTRNSTGVEYSYWYLNTKNLDIPTKEKAELLVATRQYQNAVDLLKSSLRTELASHYKVPYSREQTLKQLMVVLVRAKGDPLQAYNELQNVMSQHEVPAYLMQYIEEWESSIKDWMADEKEFNSLSKALKVAAQSSKKIKKITKTRPQEAAFVEYLRLTSVLHKAIGLSPSKNQASKIYLQLGKAYSAIKDSGFWDLPEIYYESCIYNTPKTKTSMKCYRLLEGEVMMGFTGSAGTFLPSNEKLKLNKLKKIAGY